MCQERGEDEAGGQLGERQRILDVYMATSFGQQSGTTGKVPQLIPTLLVDAQGLLGTRECEGWRQCLFTDSQEVHSVSTVI